MNKEKILAELKLQVGNIPVWKNPNHWDEFLEVVEQILNSQPESDEINNLHDTIADEVEQLTNYIEALDSETNKQIAKRVIEE